ncbi:D-aminoacyl-tRNA deacylase [Paenibacillus sp. M1]|uniref:D-aminoacyl-tRNA deacylase n=1 Tax=Paenibacillus haidiansis TaxID=1574488 RepID=A0ABU7W038_9BACL
MRIVVQRCKQAKVTISGDTVGSIEQGLVLLVGITHEDAERDAAYLADKIAGLRIFEDGEGKMNLSIADIGGAVLSVSQFTLYGDCRKGKRPSFTNAARPEVAEPLYDRFNELLRQKGLVVETGRFGADMDVEFTNWGPVTLIVEHPFA